MKWQATLTRAQLDKAVKDYLVSTGKVESYDTVQCLDAPEIRVTIVDGEPKQAEIINVTAADPQA
jgi:hypothetical protein